MNTYTPELGQMVYGNPTGAHKMPYYAESLVLHVLDQIERVYWNQQQCDWDRFDDPEISGITFRPYWWGEDDAPEAALPNFVCEGVEIRWYKHPGRGMSCDREMTPAEWCGWFDRCMDYVRKHELEVGR